MDRASFSAAFPGRAIGLPGQIAGGTVGRQARAMQGLADIDIAKAGDQFLIEQGRLERGFPSGEKLRQRLGVESVGERFDAQIREKGMGRKLASPQPAS